jgi:hypothetical protein
MKTGVWLFLATVAFRASAQDIVTNGSFESFGTTLTGWSTTESWTWAGVNSNAADGQAYVILAGNLYQDLSTVPGQVYRLRYAVAGEPSYQGPTTLQTYWGGNLAATTVFDTIGHSNENLGWTYVTNNVLATAQTTRLWFANPNYGTSIIPDLDAVSAVPVNEGPSTCIPLPAGIISWWKGEGTALDSADGNGGTLLNGAEFTNGLAGQAFYFAGGNQCIQIPYTSSLAASNYSIEAWIQPLVQIDDASTQAVLFAQNNGQCQLLARAGLSGLRVVLQFAVSSSTFVGVQSTSEIPIAQFSHVAGTWDGLTLRLYINGALDAQNTPGAVPFNSGCPFYIGGIYNTSGSCSNVAGFFNGAIDEVSYYRRPLSDAEISFIYQAGTLGKCGVVYPPSFTLQPSGGTVFPGSAVTFYAIATGDAPIGYQWRFNGADLIGKTSSSLTLTNVQPTNSGAYSVVANNAAGSAVSSSALLTVLPNVSCVTITNGLVSWWQGQTNLLDGWDSNDGSGLPDSSGVSPVGFAAGKVGQAFSFTNGGIFVMDNPSLRFSDAMTIEGWVNSASFVRTRETIFAKFDGATGTNSSYYLGINNQSLFLQVTPDGRNLITLSTTALVPSGQWSHVAATYDGSALRLYINGLLAAETNYSGGIFPGTAPAGLGAVPYFQNSARAAIGWFWSLPWYGYLDEISVYNQALSDDEILSIYHADWAGKCPGPPVIAVQPQSLAVPLNEDAIFSPKILGSKPLGYQWRFKGTNLIGRTGSRLALERVQSNIVGNYSIVVTNALGRATSSVAALTLLQPLSCVSAPTGMVAWWPANNFTNDVIGTNSVSFYPFPFGSLASYGTGKVAQCFYFTNSYPRGYADAGTSSALNIGSNADFSIETWCKVPQPALVLGFPAATRASYIVQKIFAQPPQFPLPVTTLGYSLLIVNGRIACQLTIPPFTQTNMPTFVSPGPNISDGLFHHLAFTFHRNAGNGGRLYVDGQNVFTFDTTLFGRTSLSNSASLQIGDTPVGFGDFPPTGERIDELTMYNRALSQTEVLSIYQAGSGGKCIPPPNIVVQPTNQVVQAGNLATLRAIASGFPLLNYQWIKNGTNVPGAIANVLSISNATAADSGQYSLTVSNIGGVTASATATLTVNRPPLAGNFNAATIQNQPISFPIDKLLFSASDPDGDSLTLVSIATPTPNGGSFVRSATDVTYNPPNGYIGFDSSIYTVSDGHGSSAAALINIQIRSPDDLSGNLLPLTPISGGFRVSFAGIPGRAYTLQRSDSVTGPWSNLVSVTVGPSGIAIFDDTNSPPPTAFYRTVYP